MCGIAGLIVKPGEVAATADVRDMTDAIVHRGPDGEGHWGENNVALGHRRLSILDTSEASAQPMQDENQRYVLCYNGELYNFLALRGELQKLGHHFHTSGDTEVVLKALMQWGARAFYRFNGMFAISFFDRQTGQMLIARDRYGIKPIYYMQSQNMLAFASEQKAILALKDCHTSLDKEALLEYFTFQNFFTNKTLNKDINILPQGHYARIDCRANHPRLQLERYWDFDFHTNNSSEDERSYEEELDRLFCQAVERQLVSDVPLGSYLSGGMDSGSISAIAAKEIPYINTFTCGFDLSSASGMELAFDERDVAEQMSYHFKTEHYEMVLKAGDMERCLPKLAYHLEEPRVGQSYPNYYAAKLASKFVKVVLSGAGGDEIFAGYPWRYYRNHQHNSFDDYIDNYYQFWQRMVSNSELKALFAPIWTDVSQVWTRDIFKGVFKQPTGPGQSREDYINHSLYFEAKTFLHGLLVVEDKLSMAHSLETRVPFLDNDLVDFAMNCPLNLKLKYLGEISRINENEPARKKYFEHTSDGKQILRKVMRNYIPESVTQRKKQGFSAPDASWFKGDSIDFVRAKLLNNNAKILELFDRDVMQNLINEHLSGKKNRRLLIWSLLNVNTLLESGHVNVH